MIVADVDMYRDGVPDVLAFPGPAPSHTAPAPVVEYISPAPAMSHAASAPVGRCPAPAVFAAPTPAVEKSGPAPAVSYAAPAPSTPHQCSSLHPRRPFVLSAMCQAYPQNGFASHAPTMTVTGVDFNRVGKPDAALQPQFGFEHPVQRGAPAR